jgi:hypothetical protein
MARMLLAALAAALVLAAGASADGLPVLGLEDMGTEGVAGEGVRYLALPAQKASLLLRVTLPDGRIDAFSYLPGRYYTIPAVAYDGTTDGLSGDGTTLALIQPRAGFPRAATRFVVLDAKRLRVRSHVALRGDYSFDALSPDGSTLFLIHYLSPRDPNRYEVRAYDLRHGRLLPDPIVDPNEGGEEMRGAPVTRATSPDGRWAYTLYDGAGGGHPFVHALDTVQRTARCIDLHELAGRRDLGNLRLSLGGRTLAVTEAGKAVTLIDAVSFEVQEPVAVDAPTSSASAAASWLPLLGGAMIAALGAAAIAVRRRDREAPPGGASR